MESPQPVAFDRVVLQEDITRGQQRVESLVVDTWDGTAWKIVGQRAPSATSASSS
ncbi:hypothetical protein [Streptomyces sp. NPDC053720]|uniref:hypothetical protein n=1 Tax=Streptomyces sp. NPDC053720 TaxID=3154855 RepID=UPI003433786C